MAALAQTQDRRYIIEPRPSLDEIVMLSLGTGDTSTVIKGKNLNWGYLQWGWKIRLLNMLMDGVVDVPDYECEQLLGDSNYMRLNPYLPTDKNFEMDDPSKRDQLVQFASQVDLNNVSQWLSATWMS
jgi:hypothetical protein